MLQQLLTTMACYQTYNRCFSTPPTHRCSQNLLGHSPLCCCQGCSLTCSYFAHTRLGQWHWQSVLLWHIGTCPPSRVSPIMEAALLPWPCENATAIGCCLCSALDNKITYKHRLVAAAANQVCSKLMATHATKTLVAPCSDMSHVPFHRQHPA